MEVKTLYIFLFLSINLHAQTSLIDSLNNELLSTQTDTSKIDLLIDIAYEQENHQQLQTALKAYNIAKELENQKFQAKTEVVMGHFYSLNNLDSGISLLSKGANRYLTNDMTKRAANAFWLIGTAYEKVNDLDLAILNFEKAVKIGEVNDHYKEIAEGASALATIYTTRGENVKALMNSLKSKDAFERIGMTREVGKVLNQIGIIYDHKGLYSEALKSYLQALDIAIETKNVDNEILVRNNLGVIYDNMNDIERSEEYYSGALEKASIHSMIENEATLMNNLSYIYLKKGDTTGALALLKKSIQVDLSEVYPCFYSYPNEGIGSIYTARNQLDSAEFYLKNSLKIASECEDVVVIVASMKGLGILESKKGNSNQAANYLSKSLQIAKKSKLIDRVQAAYDELYKFHKSIGETSKAIYFLEKYKSISDSVYEAKNIEKATQLAAEYEFRKQIELMDEERRKSDNLFESELKAKQRRGTLYLIITGLLALLAIALGRSYYLIQKNNKKLKWLNEEKNTLMGMVAHDLRNPLNMIKGLMDLIKDSRPKDKNTEDEHYIDLVTQSTDKMRSMIDRVLDISAVENMKVNLNLERRNLSYIVFQSSENFRQIAAQKNIEIQNEFDLKSEFHSNVDPNYLDQVMDNLLSNAIKFSDAGKKITLKLEQVENSNTIAIIDEGPGIKSYEMKNLFTKFTKLTAKPTLNEQSTGLGLSIAQKFVRAMDGEIFCESKEGVGTTFFIKFKEA